MDRIRFRGFWRIEPLNSVGRLSETSAKKGGMSWPVCYQGLFHLDLDIVAGKVSMIAASRTPLRLMSPPRSGRSRIHRPGGDCRHPGHAVRCELGRCAVTLPTAAWLPDRRVHSFPACRSRAV